MIQHVNGLNLFEVKKNESYCKTYKSSILDT